MDGVPLILRLRLFRGLQSGGISHTQPNPRGGCDPETGHSANPGSFPAPDEDTSFVLGGLQGPPRVREPALASLAVGDHFWRVKHHRAEQLLLTIPFRPTAVLFSRQKLGRMGRKGHLKQRNHDVNTNAY